MLNFNEFIAEEIDRNKIAYTKTSKFNTLDKAKNAVNRQKNNTGVLMGMITNI
jgi:hypothetical protein